MREQVYTLLWLLGHPVGADLTKLDEKDGAKLWKHRSLFDPRCAIDSSDADHSFHRSLASDFHAPEDTEPNEAGCKNVDGISLPWKGLQCFSRYGGAVLNLISLLDGCS